MKKSSWKPVRSGKIYCSPACGGGCTHERYLLAKQRANDTAKLLGKGWKPVVHENLGWHASVTNGLIQVSIYADHYGAILAGHWVGHGKTAQAAIDDAAKKFEVDFLN